MTEVAVQLPDELGHFVARSIASGAYHTHNELFVSMLATFKEQIEAPINDEEQDKLENLRADIGLAVTQLDQGEGIRDFDWDDFLEERHRQFAQRKSE